MRVECFAQCVTAAGLSICLEPVVFWPMHNSATSTSHSLRWFCNQLTFEEVSPATPFIHLFSQLCSEKSWERVEWSVTAMNELHSFLVHVTSFRAQARRMSSHPVAVSAATSSLSTTLLWILKDLAFPSFTGIDIPQLPHSFDLTCPDQPIPFNFWLGIAVGFCLWPLLEIAVLTKQWITLSLRSRIAAFNWQGKLYRVIS